MVSEEGQKWLQGLDEKSIAQRKAQAAHERARLNREFDEERKKQEYKQALPRVTKSLREEGIQKPIPYIRRSGGPGPMKDTIQATIEECDTAAGAVNTVHGTIESMEATVREIADEMDSTTMGEAAAQLSSAMSSLTGAIEHVNEAKKDLETYLQTLSS